MKISKVDTQKAEQKYSLFFIHINVANEVDISNERPHRLHKMAVIQAMAKGTFG